MRNDSTRMQVFTNRLTTKKRREQSRLKQAGVSQVESHRTAILIPFGA